MPIPPPFVDRFSAALGLSWDAEDRTRLTVGPELLNPGGTLVAGVYFSMLNYTMGSTLLSRLDAGETTATLSTAINYVAAARDGELILCGAHLDRRTRVSAVLRGQIERDDGRLLATAVGSFTILRRR